jgi:hypothetical protein
MKKGKEYVAMMMWKKRKSRLKRGGKVIYIIIIAKASRHGVSAMPWPSTDNEMEKREMMMIIVGMWGSWNIIIGENEKKKGWKSQAHQRKKK